MGEARIIYNAACAQIAAALAQDGFEYRPSKRALVRGDGDLTREITFQSSFRNFTLPEKGAGFVQKAISLLTRNGAAPLSSAGRPLVSLANSAWCTAHQRQGEKWSPSASNSTLQIPEFRRT